MFLFVVNLGLAKIGLANSAWQILIPILLALAIFVYSVSLGRNRILALLLSTYVALAVVKAIPWPMFRLDNPSVGLKIVVMLAIIFFIFIFMPNSALGDTLGLGYKKVRTALMWLFVFALLQLGLFASIILSFLPTDNLTKVPDMVKQVFVRPEAAFIWLVLPMLVIMLYRKKKSKFRG